MAGRPPDWLIYSALVAGLVAFAIWREERAPAPAAPPPVTGEAALPLAPGSPFEASKIHPVPRDAGQTTSGTAFSVSDAGVWLTARHVVADCPRAAILVADGRGVIARVTGEADSDVAVLQTQGGSAPLPLALGAPVQEGQRAYHPGFPQDRPGEAASRYLGRDSLRGVRRDAVAQPVMVWAEVGRTDGLKGVSLSGLSGAPVLDRAGRVVGLTLAESPRRGRIYAAPPEALREAMIAAGVRPSGLARGQPITVDNYGRVSDSLRRELRVARVVCIR